MLFVHTECQKCTPSPERLSYQGNSRGAHYGDIPAVTTNCQVVLTLTFLYVTIDNS